MNRFDTGWLPVTAETHQNCLPEKEKNAQWKINNVKSTETERKKKKKEIDCDA